MEDWTTEEHKPNGTSRFIQNVSLKFLLDNEEMRLPLGNYLSNNLIGVESKLMRPKEFLGL